MKTSRFASLALLLLIPQLPTRQGLSPLRYHAYKVAVVEALVQEIHTVDISPMRPPDFSPESFSRSGDAGPGKVQIISLKLAKIKKIELNRTGIPIHKGDVLEVTNQYLDQQPPFAPGQTIRVRVQLVLPEESYDPKDPRQQWWFFPQAESESILPPRLPFTGVEVVR
jgi:hypothetical protein